jgi:hypothetical protein
MLDTDQDGICDELEILGCTNYLSLNYNPLATEDNGTCIPYIFGCTDPVANNYNPLANIDNQSCIYSILGCTYPDASNYDILANDDDGSCEFNCQADLNNDGLINTSDLLDLLAVYGTSCQ